MKIAVVGAGAVGCYYGGMLARAGHEVVLIGRPLHVDAISRDGLLMDTLSFKEYVPIQASIDSSSIKGARLILCCVKSTDTDSVATEISAYLDPDTIILSMQNGIENAERLQSLLQHKVAPAVVYVASEMAGPGHVRHRGRGELVIAESGHSSELRELFANAGVPIDTSDNVAGALWAKLILNCAYNALSAITQLPYGRLMQVADVENVIRDVVRECLAIAQAEKVKLTADIWESIQQIHLTMPSQLSSTAQDLARHKRSEIDYLNGYIVRKGNTLGIPTPANLVLATLVKLIESR
jgi:2-dehydropantoate 2-reductase